MTERSAVRVRRTGMKRTLLPLVLLAAVLVGCGDGGEGDATAESKDSESSGGIEQCTPVPGGAREIADVDVDGDGEDDPIALERASAAGDTCPTGPRLLVFVEETAVAVPFARSPCFRIGNWPKGQTALSSSIAPGCSKFRCSNGRPFS